MGDTLEKPKPKEPKSSDGDDLDHVGCHCDPLMSLCGLDLTDVPRASWKDLRPEAMCKVCWELVVTRFCTGCNSYVP